MRDSLAGNVLRSLIQDAANQTAFSPIIPPGYVEPTSYFKKPAATIGTVNLNESYLPDLMDRSGNFTSLDPAQTPGGERMTIAAAILQLSRVSAMGANIIIRADPTRAVPVSPEMKGIPALESVAKWYSTIEAANMAPLSDDEEMPVSTRPVSRAEIVWADSQTHGVRFEIKRKDIILLGNDTFVNETIMSLILGLARVADAELLSRITSASPTEFSPAKVAERGLRIDEIRAIVGTNGTGAGWNGAGQFVAAGGVLADTSGDVAETVVGAFSRAGVAIHEEITLTAERRNLQGDLIFTAFANVIPLLPDPSRFWLAAA